MTKPKVSPSEFGVHPIFANGWVGHSMAASFFGTNGHTLDLAGHAAKVAIGAFRHKHRRMRGHVGNEGRYDDVDDAFFSLQAVSLQVQININDN